MQKKARFRTAFVERPPGGDRFPATFTCRLPMKRFAQLACPAALLLAAGCATTPPASSNFPVAPPGQAQTAPLARLYTQLLNPGFENWRPAAECPDAWVCIQHGGETSYRFTQDKTSKTEGAASVKIEKIATQPWGGLSQYYYLDRRLQPMTLKLSAKMKVSDMQGDGAGLMLIIDGVAGVGVKTQTKFLKGTTDWQTVEVTGKVSHETSAIRIQAIMEAEKGTVWFDEVKLEQLP
jgi:hypothetical protein